MFNIKTILHPTDFSPRSQHAFATACALARDRGAGVVLLYVVEQPLFIASGVMTAPPPPPPEDEVQAALEKLRAMAAAEPSLQLDLRVEIGEPSAAILETAKRAQADMIVMGTHGRGGLSRLLMGSVAEKVLRAAPCPVLIVKTPG